MPLVTSTEMFRKAYAGGYAVGAFNVNNMETIQGIVEAGQECNSPLILQVSAGARKYANPVYLKHLIEAAVETTNIPIVMHLDHGADFEACKSAIDDGFTSVMIDASPILSKRISRSPGRWSNTHMSAAWWSRRNWGSSPASKTPST